MPAPKLSPALAAALAASGRDPNAVVQADASAAVGATGAEATHGATGASDAAVVAAGATGGTGAAGATGTTDLAAGATAAGGTGAAGATAAEASAGATAAAAAVEANGGTGGGAPALTAAAAEAPLVTYLQGELRTERERAVQLSTDLTAAKSTITQLQAVNPGLETCLRAACERLAIGLGASTSGIAALSGQPLIDMYNTLNTDLNKRFPVGQRSSASASTAAAEAGGGKVVPLASHSAAIAATQLPGARAKK